MNEFIIFVIGLFHSTYIFVKRLSLRPWAIWCIPFFFPILSRNVLLLSFMLLKQWKFYLLSFKTVLLLFRMKNFFHVCFLASSYHKVISWKVEHILVNSIPTFKQEFFNVMREQKLSLVFWSDDTLFML